jgi:surfeit locus 1 family protein
VVLGAVLIGGFVGLGVWQVRRLAWKTALIAQVEARIHAPAAPAPGPTAWPAVTRERDQYRHVVVRGVFEHDRETVTQAVTAAGPGFWVLTPLRTEAGFTVLVNRGYVPAALRAARSRPSGLSHGQQQVCGLLRMSEPHGGFLRANDPERDLWRSRDVQAIVARRGLSDAAPYFIDADATPNPGGWPRGGMTVVRFANSHLVYAITWFALALGVAAALGAALRAQRPGDAP